VVRNVSPIRCGSASASVFGDLAPTPDLHDHVRRLDLVDDAPVADAQPPRAKCTTGASSARSCAWRRWREGWQRGVVNDLIRPPPVFSASLSSPAGRYIRVLIERAAVEESMVDSAQSNRSSIA